jgi:hypothetical protein
MIVVATLTILVDVDRLKQFLIAEYLLQRLSRPYIYSVVFTMDNVEIIP